MLAVLIRSLRDRFSSPRELLVNLEKGLLTSLAPGTFITVFYGILDQETGGLTVLENNGAGMVRLEFTIPTRGSRTSRWITPASSRCR